MPADKEDRRILETEVPSWYELAKQVNRLNSISITSEQTADNNTQPESDRKTRKIIEDDKEE